jgi:hypothetical protein
MFSLLRGGLIAAIFLLSPAQPLVHAADMPARRSFDFTYGATVSGLAPGQKCQIWFPVPSSGADQQVETVKENLPAAEQIAVDAKGNHIGYIQTVAPPSGEIAFSVIYGVTRQAASESPAAPSKSDDANFLAADRLVPIGGAPQRLLDGLTLPHDPMLLGRLLYEVVDEHMQYRKDKPGWGRGDAVWACSSGFGNCTDFHSLFISLARTRGLPCKFEIGFAIPPTRGQGTVAGYHCWAYFKPAGHGWVPVDISEANQNPACKDYYFGHLDADRVAFSTGRDLQLIPPQAGPPINFFVYPYVEVDGKPYSDEHVKRTFSYGDISDAQGGD